ncbi:hypothetical protein H5410_012946 [Solanum commersonii]|uniref:Uncharacterized protein n=1 Tax=Solanum commersonii TaxID=4109 RepID=A0A9J6AT50_SOLCO|nr:hypothetical protein H5410_012946 [Solanum commersonii]
MGRPSRPTNSITKVLTDVHEKFRQKSRRNSGSPKNLWTITHENWQNSGFTCSGAHLTLKMGWFGHRDQLAP